MLPTYQAVLSFGAFCWIFCYLFGCLPLLGHLAKARLIGNIVMACCSVLFLVESLPFFLYFLVIFVMEVCHSSCLEFSVE